MFPTLLRRESRFPLSARAGYMNGQSNSQGEMNMADAEVPEVINYFIDEAGDPALFDRRGKKVLVGEGSSKFFILGKIQVDDCDEPLTKST